MWPTDKAPPWRGWEGGVLEACLQAELIEGASLQLRELERRQVIAALAGVEVEAAAGLAPTCAPPPLPLTGLQSQCRQMCRPSPRQAPFKHVLWIQVRLGRSREEKTCCWVTQLSDSALQRGAKLRPCKLCKPLLNFNGFHLNGR